MWFFFQICKIIGLECINLTLFLRMSQSYCEKKTCQIFPPSCTRRLVSTEGIWNSSSSLFESKWNLLWSEVNLISLLTDWLCFCWVDQHIAPRSIFIIACVANWQVNGQRHIFLQAGFPKKNSFTVTSPSSTAIFGFCQAGFLPGVHLW